MRRVAGSIATGAALALVAGLLGGHAASAASNPPLALAVKASEGAGDLHLSADGRYAVFTTAKRLVPADTNNYADVYLRDLQTGGTTLVSVGLTGPANAGSSGGIAISADDHHVAFGSDASNLVSGDTNGQQDVFVRDLTTRTTSLVSVHLDSATNGTYPSSSPVISADGRYIAFSSGASNLVANDPHQPNVDVFLRDLGTGRTTQVTTTGRFPVGMYGYPGSYVNAITADGRYVLFKSNGFELVPNYGGGVQDAYVWDRDTSTTRLVSLGVDGHSSRTGRSDANGSRGTAISADGRYVAFDSDAVNMVANDTNNVDDVFVRDLQTNNTTLVSAGPGGSPPPDGASGSSSMSADGRYVAFMSTSKLLGPTVPPKFAYHIYQLDLQAGMVSLVDVSAAGTVANADSEYPSLSADGHSVTFESYASNLLSGSRPGDWLVKRT